MTELIVTEIRRRVLLCFQVALLGMVGPNLRAVTVNWSDCSIEGILYFDGDLDEQAIEDASDIEAEVMASFPEHEVSVIAQRCDSPAKPAMTGAWVFMRREPFH
jgi:hypothetical protein